MAAAGAGAANWGQLVGIAASWVISPVLGGLIAAGFLYWIKRSITWQARHGHAPRAATCRG